MTVRFDEFMPFILPYVRDCPGMVAIHAARSASIEFCRKTDWLTFEHDPIPTISGVNAYDLDLPDETMLSRVSEAWLDGQILRPRAIAELRHRYGQDWRTITSTPQFYTQISGDEVILCPVPDSVQSLKLIVSLIPTRESDCVDDSLYERWAEQIAWGARSRLYETAGQPYYDAQGALFFDAKFKAGISEARRERENSLVRGPRTVRMRAF